MEPYAISLKNKLTSLIREMSAAPAPYIKNPETDFTRKRKLSFEKVMHLLISMGGNSLYKELLESQGYDVNTATTSAFVQQRYKILPSAVEFLFHQFTQSYTDLKDYRGYRLLAIDGSDLQIAANPADTNTYFQNQL
ncbi:IS4/IS5 family transposase, partial [Paenibacillus sp. CGMCC 1.18879]|nr:IS4/IS5 family transposase [Paenibacillus sp. CGMCC 1.18879]